LDEFEITCIVKDMHGTISHCGVKGYGVQSVAIIKRLIMEETCCFFIYDGEKRRNVYTRTSSNGTSFLTTDPNGLGMNRLNFLPLIDKPLLRQLIESIRWFTFVYICQHLTTNRYDAGVLSWLLIITSYILDRPCQTNRASVLQNSYWLLKQSTSIISIP